MEFIGKGCKLTIINNRIQYPRGREHLYEDLAGTLQYQAFHKEMIRLGGKNDREYGIIGSRKRRSDLYSTSGYIGYMIEDGKIYITRFTPTSKAEASKWVREDIKNGQVWILLGEIS